MLTVWTSERVEPLVEVLAENLLRLPADPFAPEWVAVSTVAMRRWLLLALAARLGAEGPGSADGVAANIATPLAGSLLATTLAASRPGDAADPWSVERLVWAVLGDPDLPAPPGGGSRYGVARRISDLFDRYHIHRPSMVRSWAAGHDVDGLGGPLAPHHLWQAALWRRVRDALGTPSPPEVVEELLAGVAAGTARLDLPPRLSLFGMTTLPGGTGFLDLVRAIGVHRQVDLYLLEPSAVAAHRVRTAWDLRPPPRRRSGWRAVSRAEDDTAEVVCHPLLRAWGRAWRETAVLLAEGARRGVPAPAALDPGTPARHGAGPGSLLSYLQAGLREDRVPAGDVVFDRADRSVRIHACHGPTRQVEVLRDALCHLLSDPALALREDDICVVCPDLGRFAPLIEAVFGPPTGVGEVPGAPPGPSGPPALRYRIADHARIEASPVVAGTVALLELVGGRFDAAAVLDFLSLAPVQARFGLSERDVATIGDWVFEANIRWGLDPAHRSRLGLPPSIVANTWEAGLDRLLAGIAVADAPSSLALGEVAALGVEGDGIEVAGRLATCLGALRHAASVMSRPHPGAAWARIVVEAASSLLADLPGRSGQLADLDVLLAPLSAPSGPAGPEGIALDVADVRRFLDEQLAASTGRANFFRGGITVTSEKPLRGIPFRVIAIVGLDQSLPGGDWGNGDDLVEASPLVGDRNPRADFRQALLEAVLSAGDRLVVLRDGFDLQTNRPIPPSALVEDLRDALVQMVRPEDRAACAGLLETRHPRHPFDEVCLEDGAIEPEVPWSFDPAALEGALSRRSRSGTSPFLAAPLPARPVAVVDLEDLRRFLADPVESFLGGRLQVSVPRRREDVEVVLPVAMSPLALWQAGERLLAARLSGRTAQDWARVERRLGTLPPGILGEEVVAQITAQVEALVDEFAGRAPDGGGGVPEPMAVDVELADGTRVVGSVPCRLGPDDGGPASVHFSRLRPASRLSAWLDLVAVAVSHPGRSWRGLRVHRSEQGDGPPAVVDLVPVHQGEDGADAARRALFVAVDCYRRGQVEPVPLFPQMAAAASKGRPSPPQWRLTRPGAKGGGDGDRPAARFVFPTADFAQVVGQPAAPWDPPGPETGRIDRFAHYLWGAVGASVVDRVTAPSRRPSPQRPRRTTGTGGP